MVICKQEREMTVNISHEDMMKCSRRLSDLIGDKEVRLKTSLRLTRCRHRPASVTKSKMSTPNGIHSNRIDPTTCKTEVSSNREHRLPPCRKKEPSSKKDRIRDQLNNVKA
ncbi:hypothetical protein NPIL_671081 [Nephila pilipes]|uniref:Uncharacterized protein n=1 Tax=Nephila pilipes TaxID=299642 RepID=A0A8X6PNZ4_NEPPI|nr:hypothetical protein NPIL_671081 [Nephila pilipes]